MTGRRMRARGSIGIVAAAAALASAAALAQQAPAGSPQPGLPAATQPGLPIRGLGFIHPRLSPDGREVVFSYQGSIWRMGADDGVARRLAAGKGYAVEPCWSPDGKRIAYLQSGGWGGGAVMIIDASSGQPLPTPAGVMGNGKIAFTAAGAALIGNLRKAEQLAALRRLDLKTGEMKTIVAGHNPRRPWAIAADGTVAFTRTMDVPGQQQGNDGPQTDVFLAAADGGEPKRLVRFPARIYDACFSADAAALYISADLGGPHYDLWRIDRADPERAVKLTFGSADEDRPSLSADGRLLLYTDNREGATALVLRDLPSGNERTLICRRLDFGAPAGRLRLKVVDKAGGEPMTARTAILGDDGVFHAPPGALWRINREHAHFYCRGSAEFDLPAGMYSTRVFRGHDYRTARTGFAVEPGRTTEHVVALERWADPAARGWFGGDNHVHANYGYGEYYNRPADIFDIISGEGINVGNMVVANSDTDGVFDREFFRGRADPLSTRSTIVYWNQEWRSTIWGHMTLVNLNRLVEPIFLGFKDTTNPLDVPTIVDISDRTRLQGGVVNFTHPAQNPADLYAGPYAAKSLPLYAALGKIDTMDVMGTGDLASAAMYHRLLNCGLRIAPSAGTDVFLNRARSNLPGAGRVYVHCPGAFSYESWTAGLRAGRSFVSNGPMVSLKVGPAAPSDVVALLRADRLSIRAEVQSQFPLSRVEVLYNGRAVIARDLPKGATWATVDEAIAVDRSGWIALRAVGPDHPDLQSGFVMAHTAPVYVEVAGTPAGSAEDAEFFLKWIDRLWADVEPRRRIPQGDLARVRLELEQARAYYRRITAGR